MSTRIDIISSFYTAFDEDARVDSSRQGQLEYLTTMEYIHRYAPADGTLLELGAGTGRYSIALAREGFEVTALELVEHNLEQLRKSGSGLTNLHAHQGGCPGSEPFRRPDLRHDPCPRAHVPPVRPPGCPHRHP